VSEPRTAAIIVAGGSGERLGRPGGKQLAPVLGQPVLSWTLAAFDAVPQVDLIIVVCHPQRIDEYRRTAINPVCPTTPVHFAAGGDTRQASVANGLAMVPGTAEIVLVHDGARPLVTSELIVDALEALAADPTASGLAVGYPAVDTLKIVSGDTIAETPDRSRYWAIQTPQIFSASVLRHAYQAAEKDGFLGTDDASLVERLGERVVVFEGPRDNIKVTVAEDLLFVEAALKGRGEGSEE
jgi:2-C-methyl-D-erythritol 4-phosphate cytidylyltransferase